MKKENIIQPIIILMLSIMSIEDDDYLRSVDSWVEKNITRDGHIRSIPDREGDFDKYDKYLIDSKAYSIFNEEVQNLPKGDYLPKEKIYVYVDVMQELLRKAKQEYGLKVSLKKKSIIDWLFAKHPSSRPGYSTFSNYKSSTIVVNLKKKKVETYREEIESKLYISR